MNNKNAFRQLGWPAALGSLAALIFCIFADDASTVSSSIKEKADATISKPFEKGDIYKVIKEVLDKKKKG